MNGATPLRGACFFGHVDVVRELLYRGANLKAANNFGATPLTHASSRGDVEVVRALLAAGADKHHVDGDGKTAASCAGTNHHAPPDSRAAILALLAAAP